MRVIERDRSIGECHQSNGAAHVRADLLGCKRMQIGTSSIQQIRTVRIVACVCVCIFLYLSCVRLCSTADVDVVAGVGAVTA